MSFRVSTTDVECWLSWYYCVCSQNILGHVANVADMVHYHPDSPDFQPTETDQLSAGECAASL